MPIADHITVQAVLNQESTPLMQIIILRPTGHSILLLFFPFSPLNLGGHYGQSSPKFATCLILTRIYKTVGENLMHTKTDVTDG